MVDCVGVVLKIASMTTKGEGNVNLSVGTVVDTLVVLPGDLVQVIVKVCFISIVHSVPLCFIWLHSADMCWFSQGVLVPGEGIVGNVDNDAAKMDTVSALPPPSCHSELERKPKALKSCKVIPESFVEEETEQAGQNGYLALIISFFFLNFFVLNRNGLFVSTVNFTYLYLLSV